MVQAELLSIFEPLRKTMNELTSKISELISKISAAKISKNFDNFIFLLNLGEYFIICELGTRLLSRDIFGLLPEYFRFEPNQFRSVPVLSSFKHDAFSCELNECKLCKYSYA